jgi:hypothetical protein
MILLQSYTLATGWALNLTILLFALPFAQVSGCDLVFAENMSVG